MDVFSPLNKLSIGKLGAWRHKKSLFRFENSIWKQRPLYTKFRFKLQISFSTYPNLIYELSRYRYRFHCTRLTIYMNILFSNSQYWQESPFFSSLCHTLTMRAECLRWWMIHRDKVWTLCWELLSSVSFFSRADSEKDDMPVSVCVFPVKPTDPDPL